MSEKESVEHLDGLLRAELRAVETYCRVVNRFRGHSAMAVLEQSLKEHLDSLTAVRELILEHGGEPPAGSGLRNGEAAESPAALFGPDSAASALRQVERDGIRQCWAALEDISVDEAVRSLIRVNPSATPAAHFEP